MLYNVQSEQIINPVYVYAIKSSSNPGETMNNNHGPGPAKKKGQFEIDDIDLNDVE